MLSTTFDRSAAIARYIEIAPRLPIAVPVDSSQYVNCLADLFDEFDAFVLDGFGVLNVGNTAIPNAVERVAQMQQAGKKVVVLTNGATSPVQSTFEKYQKWGFDIALDAIVSSRNALQVALESYPANFNWGVAATHFAQLDQLASNTVLLEDDAAAYEGVDGFIFLSATDWSESRQTLLLNALAQRERPLLVGNPDLVAPQKDCMSLEPGFFSHALADVGVCKPEFYGKPFANAFELVAPKLVNIEPHRIAMVGDTLHTDILGGSAFGWRTILIRDFGLLKEQDVELRVKQSGIRPHFVSAIT